MKLEDIPLGFSVALVALGYHEGEIKQVAKLINNAYGSIKCVEFGLVVDPNNIMVVLEYTNVIRLFEMQEEHCKLGERTSILQNWYKTNGSNEDADVESQLKAMTQHYTILTKRIDELKKEIKNGY